jgi:hypothetical protein
MKDFVFHEEALALKELGFDEPCLKFYANKKLVLALDTDNGDINSKLNQYNPLYVSAPTFSQAFRFFREKYDLHQHIEYIKIADRYDYWVGLNFKYTTTYEDAELQCLRKLIEIVKQKQ